MQPNWNYFEIQLELFCDPTGIILRLNWGEGNMRGPRVSLEAIEMGKSPYC